jgi:hypothetical protein
MTSTGSPELDKVAPWSRIRARTAPAPASGRASPRPPGAALVGALAALVYAEAEGLTTSRAADAAGGMAARGEASAPSAEAALSEQPASTSGSGNGNGNGNGNATMAAQAR